MTLALKGPHEVHLSGYYEPNDNVKGLVDEEDDSFDFEKDAQELFTKDKQARNNNNHDDEDQSEDQEESNHNKKSK